MKFIPLLITVLLICAGADHISAGSFSETGCFSDKCHKSTPSDAHGGDIYTDHQVTRFSTCLICHEGGCGNIITPTKTKPKTDSTSSNKDSSSDPDTQKMTLFTEKDSETVMQILIDSGAGVIFAGLDLLFKVSLWIVPLLIFLGLIVYSFLNKSEEHKKLITAILVIIVVVIAIKMYFSFIGNFTPDLSVIEF